jgi:excisionase family DNA binding protein
MVVFGILYTYIRGTVPKITPPLPTITHILRTTAGVKRLTMGLSGWDNADTGALSRIHGAVRGLASVVKTFGHISIAGVAFLVNESREVMNVRQASQYLGISPDTLYRYITEGEIPAFKLGNRWKLRKTILDRWMERKMSQVHAKRR